jgi:dihydrofolate reductase
VYPASSLTGGFGRAKLSRKPFPRQRASAKLPDEPHYLFRKTHYIVHTFSELTRWVIVEQLSYDSLFVPEAIAAWKADARLDILIFGSGKLAATLRRSGLIHEYCLAFNRVVLRGASPLFVAGAPSLSLALVAVKPFASGIVELRYRRVSGRENWNRYLIRYSARVASYSFSH